MPLVVFCGIPASGKTTHATELEKLLKEKGKEVFLLNEEVLRIDKNEGYKDSRHEKNTRGTLKAAIERLLTADVTVIADSLNYIKGFRYELYCLARAAATSHCVVYCNIPFETARVWNTQRENKFSDALCEDLARRFEVPNPRNRWDKPLFTVGPGESLPFDLISEALYERQGYTPNVATLPQVLSDTNFVYELDRITQEIVSGLLEQQKCATVGDTITVPGATQKLRLTRTLNMAELRRLRRQFLKLTAVQALKATEIGDSFVEYLNANLSG